MFEILMNIKNAAGNTFLSLLSDVLFDVTKNARDFFIRCEIEKTTWKTEITVENITRVVNQPTCCPGYIGQGDQYS